MWQLAGNTATWQRDEQLSASIDLQHPAPGLEGIVFLGQPLHDATVLQMHLSAAVGRVRLEDCYVRGHDLIANYADVEGRIRAAYYWRVQPGQSEQPGTFAIESWVSTQTDLLDSDPGVAVRCRLPAASCDLLREPEEAATMRFTVSQEPRKLGIECGSSPWALRFRLPECPLVCFQLLDAADVVFAELQGDVAQQTITSTVSFFPGRVEKGVIRRARLRAILATEDLAARVLQEQWTEMLYAPPPLAT